MRAQILLALIAATWAAGYLFIACRFWPFAPCRRCHGKGRLLSPLGRGNRLCPRCRGEGHRLRPGRRITNYLSSAHRDIRDHL